MRETARDVMRQQWLGEHLGNTGRLRSRNQRGADETTHQHDKVVARLRNQAGLDRSKGRKLDARGITRLAIIPDSLWVWRWDFTQCWACRRESGEYLQRLFNDLMSA